MYMQVDFSNLNEGDLIELKMICNTVIGKFAYINCKVICLKNNENQYIRYDKEFVKELNIISSK